MSIASDKKLCEFILQDLKYAKIGIGHQFEKLLNDEADNKRLSKWLEKNEINFQNL